MSDKPFAFSEQTAKDMIRMLRWFKSNGGMLSPMGPPSPNRANQSLERAKTYVAIAAGETGECTLYRGAEKGSETAVTGRVTAFNRLHDVESNQWVQLAYYGGMWEIVRVDPRECQDLGDPKLITGWDGSKKQVLVHTAGTMEEDFADACYAWVDVDEDCE